MQGITVHVELLIQPLVTAPDGRTVGRIGEVRAERRGDELVVEQYEIGRPGLLVRLTAAILGSNLLRAFHVRRKPLGWCARWDQLDLSDPAHPRLTCPVDELEPLWR